MLLVMWQSIPAERGPSFNLVLNSQVRESYLLKSLRALFIYLYTTTTTTTTSLFQFKYSLQSLCPQLVTAIRGGYKRKKGNYIIIHIYLKRTILEAI